MHTNHIAFESFAFLAKVIWQSFISTCSFRPYVPTFFVFKLIIKEINRETNAAVFSCTWLTSVLVRPCLVIYYEVWVMWLI